MSGTGKSSVLRSLAARGFETVDTDDEGWCERRAGEHGQPELLWREDRVRALLDTPRDTALFVQGCVPNQGRFCPDFAQVVLLTAPLDVMRARILERPDNPFGKSDAQWAQIVADTAEVVPLLRPGATLELETSHLSVAEVTDRLAALVSSERRVRQATQPSQGATP